MHLQNLITMLLSHHRQPNLFSQPLALTQQQIFSAVRYAVPPDCHNWQDEAQRSLDELYFQGEILLGVGKRYCIGPPTLISVTQEDVSSLRFQGDRAYLALVHQALRTNQSAEELVFRSVGLNFQQIQSVLKSINVRLITIEDSLNELPLPRKPIILKAVLENSPFVNYSEIEVYIPESFKSQAERWQLYSKHSTKPLLSESLLRLPTNEYLWIQEGLFYELESEIAVLAMFAQDAKGNQSLLLPWDEQPGRLDLQGVILPSAYARYLWRLSEPDSNRYRTRLVPSRHRPFVKQALSRLSCQLV